MEKFQHMTGDCPRDFLQTALCCCQVTVSQHAFISVGSLPDPLRSSTSFFQSLQTRYIIDFEPLKTGKKGVNHLVVAFDTRL